MVYLGKERRRNEEGILRRGEGMRTVY